MTNNESLATVLDRITEATANHIRIIHAAHSNPRFAQSLLEGRIFGLIDDRNDEDDDKGVLNDDLDALRNCPGPLLHRAVKESAARTITMIRHD